jgi:hypothetical protein
MNRKQPVCVGVSETGELVWSHEAMELWQIIQLFRKQYQGDFVEQWMWICAHQKGMDWTDNGGY